MTENISPWLAKIGLHKSSSTHQFLKDNHFLKVHNDCQFCFYTLSVAITCGSECQEILTEQGER